MPLPRFDPVALSHEDYMLQWFFDNVRLEQIESKDCNPYHWIIEKANHDRFELLRTTFLRMHDWKWIADLADPGDGFFDWVKR